MKGGNWVERDKPEVIQQKETILAAGTTPNLLQRIAIEFATEKITDKLKCFQTTEKVVIVLEGVSMCLTDEQFTDTLQQFEQLFPNHTLVCDLLTTQFFNRCSYRLRKRLNDFGAVFKFQHINPQAFILKYNYTLQNKISVIATGNEQGNLRVPKLLQWLFKKIFRSAIQLIFLRRSSFHIIKEMLYQVLLKPIQQQLVFGKNTQ